MNVYVLEWNYCDGYEHSNAVIGVYGSVVSAESAYKTWLKMNLGRHYDVPEEMERFEMVITQHFVEVVCTVEAL